MRMWEIREGDTRHERGYRHSDKSLEEAYACGYEDGYEDALEKMEYEEHELDHRMAKRGIRGYRRSMR